MRIIAGVLIAGVLAYALEPAADRVTVPFSDPGRPKTVKVSLMNGGITVKGYAGKDVIAEARPRAGNGGGSRRAAPPNPKAEGLRRLDDNSTGLSVEEQDNTVTIGLGMGGMSGTVDLVVQVPVDTSLHLKTMGGAIEVQQVNGEIDANDMNGPVTLTNVSGTVVAHSMNGNVTVSMDRVAPGKPMSFSSFNGDVDLTLPADTKANLKMKTENGEVYTDFEIQTSPGAPPVAADNRKGGGRYRVKFEKGLQGTINGGGPEVQLTTFNGKLYIRKKK